MADSDPKPIPAAIPHKSHGLPGKCLVFEAGNTWCCTGCGHTMTVSPSNYKCIRCVNPKCEKYQWDLIRPDLASCEVIDRPVAHAPESAIDG